MCNCCNKCCKIFNKEMVVYEFYELFIKCNNSYCYNNNYNLWNEGKDKSFWYIFGWGKRDCDFSLLKSSERPWAYAGWLQKAPGIPSVLPKGGEGDCRRQKNMIQYAVVLIWLSKLAYCFTATGIHKQAVGLVFAGHPAKGRVCRILDVIASQCAWVAWQSPLSGAR